LVKVTLYFFSDIDSLLFGDYTLSVMLYTLYVNSDAILEAEKIDTGTYTRDTGTGKQASLKWGNKEGDIYHLAVHDAPKDVVLLSPTSLQLPGARYEGLILTK
jgi:hypothetical protein